MKGNCFKLQLPVVSPELACLVPGSYFALPELLGNYCTLAGYFANKDDYLDLLAYHR